MSKRKVAQGLSFLNLLALICVSCGSESLGFIIVSGIVFLGSPIFWAAKGGAFT